MKKTNNRKKMIKVDFGKTKSLNYGDELFVVSVDKNYGVVRYEEDFCYFFKISKKVFNNLIVGRKKLSDDEIKLMSVQYTIYKDVINFFNGDNHDTYGDFVFVKGIDVHYEGYNNYEDGKNHNLKKNKVI